MTKITTVACVGLLMLWAALTSQALVMTDSEGRWPADWPRELEVLRGHARTINVASRTQENIYEITFSDRAEFEKAWPVILSLKSPGAPLRLYNVGKLPSAGLGQLESNDTPLVRIYVPSQSEVLGPDGQQLKASAPWPKELSGVNGELPEFVRTETKDGKLGWTPIDDEKGEHASIHYRARVDIDLVLDGKVIDLNRVMLPKGTPIDDHRF